jgi:hypothetical protein
MMDGANFMGPERRRAQLPYKGKNRRSGSGGYYRVTSNLRVMQEPMINSRNFRYLKIATALILISSLFYALHTPLGRPGGGTWLGYTLGGVATAIIIWLAWFGVRKRRYGQGKLLLQEWVSAHIYLGLSLVVITTLHAGFQVGWNVHTLAYVLLLVVILSGVIGIYLYMRLPMKMSENRGGITLDETMSLMADMDNTSMNLAIKLGDEVNSLVNNAIENTRVGGSIGRQLIGFDFNCPTAAALNQITALVKTLDGAEAEFGRQLVLLLARKNEMLQVARRDIQYRAWLNIWLLVHVPCTIALLTALFIHIFSVFFYW